MFLLNDVVVGDHLVAVVGEGHLELVVRVDELLKRGLFRAFLHVSAKHMSCGEVISKDFMSSLSASMVGSRSCCHQTKLRSWPKAASESPG